MKKKINFLNMQNALKLLQATCVWDINFDTLFNMFLERCDLWTFKEYITI